MVDAGAEAVKISRPHYMTAHSMEVKSRSSIYDGLRESEYGVHKNEKKKTPGSRCIHWLWPETDGFE